MTSRWLLKMFQVVTNGRYKSIEHRAFVSSQPRMSIGTFVSPSDESIIGPIPELLAEGELPKYKQRSFDENKKSYHKSYLGSWCKRTSGKDHLHTFMAPLHRTLLQTET